MSMEELLRSLGFSREFIDALEQYERNTPELTADLQPDLASTEDFAASDNYVIVRTESAPRTSDLRITVTRDS